MAVVYLVHLLTGQQKTEQDIAEEFQSKQMQTAACLLDIIDSIGPEDDLSVDEREHLKALTADNYRPPITMNIEEEAKKMLEYIKKYNKTHEILLNIHRCPQETGLGKWVQALMAIYNRLLGFAQ